MYIFWLTSIMSTYPLPKKEKNPLKKWPSEHFCKMYVKNLYYELELLVNNSFGQFYQADDKLTTPQGIIVNLNGLQSVTGQMKLPLHLQRRDVPDDHSAICTTGIHLRLAWRTHQNDISSCELYSQPQLPNIQKISQTMLPPAGDTFNCIFGVKTIYLYFWSIYNNKMY